MSKFGALIDALCKIDSEGAVKEGNKLRRVRVWARILCH